MEFETMMQKQPEIKYCPSCKQELKKFEHSSTNAFECSNCDMIWNIQYMKVPE